MSDIMEYIAIAILACAIYRLGYHRGYQRGFADGDQLRPFSEAMLNLRRTILRASAQAPRHEDTEADS